MTDVEDVRFTPERRAAIIDAISHQIPLEIASQANGISDGSMREWLARGLADFENNPESEYSKFLMDVRRAEMQCIRFHVDIMSARAENWEAHAWLLEHRWSSLYSL